MKRVICILILAAMPAGADLFEEATLQSRIRLLRQVYRINAPIPVHFTVINNGPKPVTIRPSIFLYRNFRFRVRTMQNVHVKYRDAYYLKVRKSRHETSIDRPVRLMPGEQWGRVIDIGERFDLKEPGHYEVTGYFFANPMRSDDDARIASNRSRFILKPPLPVAKAVRKYAAARKKYLHRYLSPADTVEFMLASRKSGDWEGYFLYMDLPALLKIFPDFGKRYDAADYGGKADVLRAFREHLKNFPVGELVSYFAGKTEITKDEMTGFSTARVTCRVVYMEGPLKVRRDYYYTLYRKFDRWYIEKFYVVRR